jgi:hypothetical protein
MQFRYGTIIQLPLAVILASLFLISASMNLGLKIPLGFTELGFAAPSMSIAEFEIAIGSILLVAAALRNRWALGGAYLMSIVGITEGLLASDVQGLARVFHETMVPFAIGGVALVAIDARAAYKAKRNKNAKQKSFEITTALQFLVGGLVTLGGAAYARSGTFPVGTALGLIHLAVGLAGLLGGYFFLRRKPWSREFLIGINSLTISYSALAEGLAQMYAFLSPGINDALIGTIIAIIVSAVIIYRLSNGRPQSFPVARNSANLAPTSKNR